MYRIVIQNNFFVIEEELDGGGTREYLRTTLGNVDYNTNEDTNPITISFVGLLKPLRTVNNGGTEFTVGTLKDSDGNILTLAQIHDTLTPSLGFSRGGGNGIGGVANLFELSNGNSAIFDDSAARDTYFSNNPDDLTDIDANPSATIKLLDDGAGNIVYQQRANSVWKDVTLLIQGEDGDTRVPINKHYVKTYQEFLTALAYDATEGTNIIVLTTDIVADSSQTLNVPDVHFIITNTGIAKNKLIFNDAVTLTLNGQKNYPIEFFAPVEFIGTTNTLSGTIWYRFRTLVGDITLTVTDAVKIDYEYRDTRITITNNSSDSINQDFWDNTNKVTSISAIENYIQVSTKQELIDALAKTVSQSSKTIELLNAIDIDTAETLVINKICNIIDSGFNLGFGFNNTITLNPINNGILTIMPQISLSTINIHTTTITSNNSVNIFVRRVRGSSILNIEGSVSFFYESLSQDITYNNTSNFLSEQRVWNNSFDITTVDNNFIPFKEDGRFVNGPIQKVADNDYIARNVRFESRTIPIGSNLLVGEGLGELLLRDPITNATKRLIYIENDLVEGSKRPVFFETLEGNTLYGIQTDISTQITNTSSDFIFTNSLTGQINSFTIVTFGNIRNLRVKITNNTTGRVEKYIPSETAWITEKGGLDFDNDGTNLVVEQISIEDTPILLTESIESKVEIKADELNLMGDSTGLIGLSAYAQKGEFIGFIYKLKPFSYVSGDGTVRLTSNIYISASLDGLDGVLLMPENPKQEDVVKLLQLVNIGNNKLTLQTTNGDLFVYQKQDGSQIRDTSVEINRSIEVEFTRSGNTWRFYQ